MLSQGSKRYLRGPTCGVQRVASFSALTGPEEDSRCEGSEGPGECCPYGAMFQACAGSGALRRSQRTPKGFGALFTLRWVPCDVPRVSHATCHRDATLGRGFAVESGCLHGAFRAVSWPFCFVFLPLTINYPREGYLF